LSNPAQKDRIIWKLAMSSQKDWVINISDRLLVNEMKDCRWSGASPSLPFDVVWFMINSPSWIFMFIQQESIKIKGSKVRPLMKNI